MPTTANYYNSLITKLTASAEAKKAAYDAALQRATTVSFDKQGNIQGYAKYDPTTGKKLSDVGGGGGTLDVQYLENKRNIQTSGEASGTLRSGQQAKKLADAMAAYKTAVADATMGTAAAQTDIDTQTGLKKAEYAAMYNPSLLKPKNNKPAGSRTGTRSRPDTGGKGPTGPGSTPITPIPAWETTLGSVGTSGQPSYPSSIRAATKGAF